MGECKHPNDPCIKENEGKTRCVCGDATNKRQLTCNGKKWKPNGGCKKKYCNCNKCEFLSNIPTDREGNPAWGDCLWSPVSSEEVRSCSVKGRRMARASRTIILSSHPSDGSTEIINSHRFLRQPSVTQGSTCPIAVPHQKMGCTPE
ncbi:hypothetical protein KC367_g173 [Hortaea werneckii]|nr:hypothetical protein KC367_g173 [Hortaea werneckii]